MTNKSEAPNFVEVGMQKVPTNRYAATRPYCTKHSRAMLDIGGEKKCPACVKEAQAANAVGERAKR